MAAINGRCVHEWNISRDPSDPASWDLVKLPITLISKLTVTDLQRGEVVYFRHRITNKDATFDWDGPIDVTVK